MRATEEDLPPIVPPKKRPALLAIAALLVLAWLGFLAFMAIIE